MSVLPTTFDATTIEPAGTYEPLPPGRYSAHIIQSEMRVTKDGQGQYLWLEIEVLEGDCQGRRLYERLNLINANEKAVEIARRALSSICHAVGKMQVSDSEELHFIMFYVDVKVQPPKDGYGASNTMRYVPLAQATAAAGAAPRADATSSAPSPTPRTAGPVPPWQRR